MKIDESYLERRRFLCGMLGGGAVTLAAGAAAPLTFYSGNLRADPPPLVIEVPPAQWDLAPGESRFILYGRMPALLIRPPEPDSALRVFVATCTHFDCTVGYRPQENRIFCACHGGYYDVDGNVTAGPPPRPLRRFFHQIHDGRLFIALEKENLPGEKACPKPDA